MATCTRRRVMRGSISTGYFFAMMGNNNGSPREGELYSEEWEQRQWRTEHREKTRLLAMINAELSENGFSFR